MDTYQCPVCGGKVTRDDGCRGCGRPYDPDVAALAMFQRTVASLEAKKRAMHQEGLMVRSQLAHASAQRDSLARKVRRKMEAETPGVKPTPRTLRSRVIRRNGTQPTTPATPPPAMAAPTKAEPSTASPTTAPPKAGPATADPTVGQTTDTPGATRAAGTPGAARPPEAGPHTAVPPEARAAGTPGAARPPEAGPHTAVPPEARPAKATPAAAPGKAAPGAAQTTGARATAVPPEDRAGKAVPPKGPAPRGGLPPRIAARLPGVTAERPGRRRVRKVPAASRPPVHGAGRLGGAETTTRTSQTVLLALSGLLLGGAAIVLTFVGFGTVPTALRIVLLAVVTPLLLLLPLPTMRRGLVATAEMFAAVGLLLVFLDGYVVWRVNLLGVQGLPTQFYFGLVCAATAAAATAYRAVSHLKAPRFATVLVLQPMLPLLTYALIRGSATGWGLVLTAVAAMDVALAVGSSPVGPPAAPTAPPPPTPPAPPTGPPAPVPPAPPTGPPPPVPPGPPKADPTPPPVSGPPISGPPRFGRTLVPDATTLLRESTWGLFTLAFGLALAAAATAMVNTNALAPTVRAATVLLLAAGVGLVGSVRWRRDVLVDVTGGLATLAVVGAITRVGAVALPGRTLLFAALAVAVAALVVRVLPESARRGPELASGAAAAGIALYLVVKALPAIMGPVRAALPAWNADLARYPGRLAAAAGPSGWQLPVAGALLTVAVAVALPQRVRTTAVLTGTVITALVAPAALRLSWSLTPAVLAAVAIAYGVSAMLARQAPTARGCLVAAGVVGGYAFLTSLAKPGSMSLTLFALAFAGAIIAAPRPARTDPYAEAVAQEVADTAAGGAALALPGAIAAGIAALIGSSVLPGAGATAILAGSFIACCLTLGYAAAVQVKRRGVSRPLLVGTTVGTGAVAIAALVAHGATTIDMGVGLALFASALVLWLSPTLDPRDILGQRLEGPDLAAAAVTASILAALARVVSLAMPGAGLVVAASLVVLTAVVARSLPEDWRRGPVVGDALVGGVVAALTGGAAIGAGAGVIRAAGPMFRADLGPHWSTVAGEWAAFGWQTPVALLLLAVASAVAVPPPYGEDGAAYALGLAAVSAPVGLGLPWWSPMVLGIGVAGALGVAAAVSAVPRTASTRLAVAGMVGLYAAGASLVRSYAAAGALESMAFVATIVAVVAGVQLAAARTATQRASRAHLVPVGGTAAAGALLALTGASAAFAAGERHPADAILTASLAALGVGVAAAGWLCRRLPGFLTYVSAAVALSGTVIALAALTTPRHTGVYAAAAALLGILAELLRVGARRSAGWRPEDDGLPPAGTWGAGGAWATTGPAPWRPLQSWRPVNTSDFGIGVTAAGAIPGLIALIVLVRPLAAALVAPYHWVSHPWTGNAETAGTMGQYASWIGTPTDVLAAVLLTVAGALAAVGLGGRAGAVASRAVAVAIPGAAVTMLIAPSALGWPGPSHATAALLVATLCGLGLALTPAAAQTSAANALRHARRAVFVLALLAAGAGMTGSLATRGATIEALAGSVLVGLVGAIGGRYRMARLIGWNVAAGAAELLALASALAAGWPAKLAAFPVLGVAALLLAFPLVLPRIRDRDTTREEILVIEATAYLGALGALALTYGAPTYTAAITTALGAVLGLAASRPGRDDRYRTWLIVSAAASEVVAVWLIARIGNAQDIEAYTLPFAALALLVGLLELRRRPDLTSTVAYGPALVAAFLPSLAIVVLSAHTSVARQVLLLVAAVLTAAVGAVRRQLAPVVVGSVVTVIATVRELFRLGLPSWMLLLLFVATGLLLAVLGGTEENRRRLRGARSRYR